MRQRSPLHSSSLEGHLERLAREDQLTCLPNMYEAAGGSTLENTPIRTTSALKHACLKSFGGLDTTINAAFALVAILCLIVAVTRQKSSKLRSFRSRSPDIEKHDSTRPSASRFKAPERKPGEWTPVPFARPKPVPYPNWSITDTKPLPYRPFRYGPKYNVTMGLRTMHWDEWIELDNQFLRFHAAKARRIRERGDKCCRTAPEAYDAAVELLQELRDYLPLRYPSLYAKTEDGGGLSNLATGEHFDISTRPLAEDPMRIAARLIQDDIAIMLERPDSGQYHLLAGCILLPGFWRLEDKFGLSLSDIHTSGHVPQFEQKLERGMMNLFRRMKVDAPVVRHNYFVQMDGELGVEWVYWE